MSKTRAGAGGDSAHGQQAARQIEADRRATGTDPPRDRRFWRLPRLRSSDWTWAAASRWSMTSCRNEGRATEPDCAAALRRDAQRMCFSYLCSRHTCSERAMAGDDRPVDRTARKTCGFGLLTRTQRATTLRNFYKLLVDKHRFSTPARDCRCLPRDSRHGQRLSAIARTLCRQHKPARCGDARRADPDLIGGFVIERTA